MTLWKSSWRFPEILRGLRDLQKPISWLTNEELIFGNGMRTATFPFVGILTETLILSTTKTPQTVTLQVTILCQQISKKNSTHLSTLLL